MKITKTFSGEKYWFRVKVTNYKTKECEVKMLGRNGVVIGTITDDFKYISLSTPVKLTGYWNTIDQLMTLPRKDFHTLKINKEFQKSLRNDFEL